MPLSQRQYDCGSCNLSIDRDLNASLNLRHLSGGILPPENAVLNYRRIAKPSKPSDGSPLPCSKLGTEVRFVRSKPRNRGMSDICRVIPKRIEYALKIPCK